MQRSAFHSQTRQTLPERLTLDQAKSTQPWVKMQQGNTNLASQFRMYFLGDPLRKIPSDTSLYPEDEPGWYDDTTSVIFGCRGNI